jgi:hypothetical protein
MDVSLVYGSRSQDQLRELRSWLLEESELRGRVRTRERPPDTGTLGPVLEALQIASGPVAAAVSASLVSWLRTRVGDVKLTVTSRDGRTMQLEASKVRGLDAESVGRLSEQVTALAEEGEAPLHSSED